MALTIVNLGHLNLSLGHESSVDDHSSATIRTNEQYQRSTVYEERTSYQREEAGMAQQLAKARADAKMWMENYFAKSKAYNEDTAMFRQELTAFRRDLSRCVDMYGKK